MGKSIPNQNQQAGVALITVLVISAILIVYATFILNDRQISDRRTFNILNASRAQQYMAGAETFGISLLEQFLQQSKAKRLVRTQQWATTPMQFPIEDNQGTLEGSVRDMHSCFNLNSIVLEQQTPASGAGQTGSGQAGGTDTELTDPNASSNATSSIGTSAGFGSQLAGEKIFIKIIEPLLPSETEATPTALAASLRDWVDEDQEVAGADGAEDYTYTGYEIPYRTGDTLLAHSSELLVIKGFTPAIYDAIKDYICVLPTKEGSINVNTVKPEQAELVWALLDGVDLATVRQVLEDMPDDGYEQGDFFTALGSGKLSKEGAGRLVFDSQYLLLTATANIKTGRAQTKSLLLKNNDQFQVVSRHIGD
ncbi:type II secretion system minor pseudopilin GspK [Kangiella sp. TOML190]|uniref:type II secretion system minor pseudopilin GspK n=1 Tax=Kangiella sp. TOML190 TaxID=2931351 RepID=UPI00204217DF|nr:type II secretion system minor pseudopilin GspK [Kangiella sp. TOML190]